MSDSQFVPKSIEKTKNTKFRYQEQFLKNIKIVLFEFSKLVLNNNFQRQKGLVSSNSLPRTQVHFLSTTKTYSQGLRGLPLIAHGWFGFKPSRLSEKRPVFILQWPSSCVVFLPIISIGFPYVQIGCQNQDDESYTWGCLVILMIPVSQRCILGLSTAATSSRLKVEG